MVVDRIVDRPADRPGGGGCVMKPLKRLPDAELEIMRVIWQNTSPISTNQIIALLGSGKTRKPQTVLTLLARLIEKGYLQSEKIGKERVYSPIISYEVYLSTETESFLDRIHGNSVLSLINTLYDGKELSEEEIADLRAWLEKKAEKK